MSKLPDPGQQQPAASSQRLCLPCLPCQLQNYCRRFEIRGITPLTEASKLNVAEVDFLARASLEAVY